MTLAVAVVYPDLLGTYGDGGNGEVLARRAAWRGIAVDLLEAPSGAPLPTADLYCLGGGEDGPQARAAALLREDATLGRAAQRGAVVLAVCAGYQIAGTSFEADGSVREGLGLLDVTTAKAPGPRAVGELVADPLDAALPPLTGFENHGGATTLGPAAEALALVRSGIGNGRTTNGGRSSEGAAAGRVFGTYLHGPVLARNPALADHLLALAIGAPALSTLDDAETDALRAERLVAARRAGRSRWARFFARR
jgi:lipid II isoglutaminyl synthase (glutamine-hydrolysing)